MVTPENKHLESNEVTIRGDLIFVKLEGKQTKSLAQKTLEAFKACVAELKSQDKKVYVLVDCRHLNVSDMTVDARLAVKEAFVQPYEALAALGNSHLAEMTLYLMKVGGTRERAKHFTSEKKAREWLQEVKHPKRKRGNLLPITASVVGLIGLLSVIGWTIENQQLMRFVSELRPINPLGAVGLILLSAALFATWLERVRTSVSISVVLIVLGVLALLPVDIDHLLFGRLVREVGAHSQLADVAGICFIASGLSLLVIRMKGRIAIICRTILAAIIIGIALFNLFGLLYARDALYGISPTFAMAFSLALALLIAGAGLVGLLLYGRQGNILAHMSRLSWLIIAALLLLQVGTYTSWQQSIERNHTDSQRAFDLRAKELNTEVQSRVQAYIDALYGFKGLFAASNGVNEAEFNAYYSTLGLAEKYPGIRAISFISAVDEKDLSTFVKNQQNDTSVRPQGNPDFTIQQKSASQQHYILTYVANTTNPASPGRDFADDPVRKATYEQAIATGKPAVSDTLSFAATATAPASKGFFITIPLSAHNAQLQSNNGQYIGFVSTIFNYSDFFANAFDSSSLLQDMNVRITDTTSGDALFTSEDAQGNDASFTYNERITVADRTWTIAVQAPSTFGASEGQSSLPRVILTGGQAAALLLIIIFWIQYRARQRALKLADDITADLQQERNQAVSIRNKDEAILSSIGDAVFALDTKERITLFNPAAQHISGYTEKEALGKHYSDILKFAFETGGKVNDSFIKKALGGKLASMENHTVLIRKDGTKVAVADSAAPIRDLSGKIIGAIVVFRDVSKEYELDRAKTEFVSLASHQLRTPLSAINWYAEMLLNGDAGKVTKDQRMYLQEIYEGNQRMVELVNSLLDVSRLELGKLTNEPAKNDMAELISSLEKEMVTTITSKQLQVKTTIDSDLDPVVADPKLVRMIVQNLLSNAVKYTPEKGAVTVTARRATDAEIRGAGIADAPSLFFSVKDSGYGIPKAQQSKIFSKLFRADNVRALDVEGTGLGLYIVKEVVEKLGGRVWFESIEGEGSSFYVVLPFTTKSSK